MSDNLDTVRSLARDEIDEQMAETGTVDLDLAASNVRDYLGGAKYADWNDVMDVVLELLEEDE